MTLTERELKFLVSAVTAWKAQTAAAAECKAYERGDRARAYDRWCAADHPARGPLLAALQETEGRTRRLRNRMWDYDRQKGEALKKLMTSVGRRLPAPELPPVSDAPIRNPDGYGRERDEAGKPIPLAWRVGECGEGAVQ